MRCTANKNKNFSHWCYRTSLFQTLAKMAVGEEEEVQDPEGHEEEVKVEVHPRIHLFRKAGVLRSHRTWRVPEGLVEVREDGDLITDLDGAEGEGVSFHCSFVVLQKHVEFDWLNKPKKTLHRLHVEV